MSSPTFKAFEQSWFAQRLKLALQSIDVSISDEQVALACSNLFSTRPESSWVNGVNQKILDYINTHPETHIVEAYWDYYADKQLLGLTFSSGMRKGDFALYLPQSSDEYDEIWPRNIEAKGGFNSDDLVFIREVMGMIPTNYQELSLVKLETIHELFVENEEGADTSIVTVYDKYSKE